MQTTFSSGDEFYDHGYYQGGDDGEEEFEDKLDFSKAAFCGRKKELDVLKRLWGEAVDAFHGKGCPKDQDKGATAGRQHNQQSCQKGQWESKNCDKQMIPGREPIFHRTSSSSSISGRRSRFANSKQESLQRSQRLLVDKAVAKAATRHGNSSTISSHHHQQQSQHQQQEFYDFRSNSLSELDESTTSVSGNGDINELTMSKQQKLKRKTGKSKRSELGYAPPVVVLAGYSGTGKTALVEHFLSSIISQKTNTMLRGRFHHEDHCMVGATRQYSAIVEALSGYFHANRSNVEHIQRSLTSHELRILGTILPGVTTDPNQVSRSSSTTTSESMVPSAQRRISITSSSALVNNDVVRVQLSKVLMHTISAICSKNEESKMDQNGPMILFLDDLQNADLDSFELLSTLVLDPSLSRRVVLIACARADEMDAVSRQIKRWKSAGRDVEKIELLNLSLSETNVYVSSLLQLPLEETQPLTSVIYNKTRGNLFFTKQSLEALESANAIFFSMISFRWEWSHSLEGIVELAAKVPDNVADAVAGNLLRAPEKLQRVLVVAAYTRAAAVPASTLLSLLTAGVDTGVSLRQPKSSFGGKDMDGDEENDDEDDEDTSSEVVFNNFSGMTKDELVKLLDVAVLEGHLSNRMGSDVYEFSHDRIQQAAYDMVSPGYSRHILRTRIGKTLFQLATTAVRNFDGVQNDNWMLFVAADHINTVVSEKGVQHIDDDTVDIDVRLDSLFLAQLNHKAGKKAVDQATFLPALKYLQNSCYAIQRIEDHWQSQYQLSLQVFRLLSDVQLCLGVFKAGNKLAQQILEHSENLYDMLPTYLSLASALGRQECHAEAQELLREALVVSNELPKRFVSANLIKEQMAVKKLLRKNSDYDILLLPIMTFVDKMAAMRCLSECCTRAYQCGNLNEFLMCVLRMIKITFKHGLCGETAHAFAAFGLYLFGPGDNQEGGLRLARLAKRVLDHTKAKHMESIVTSLVTLHIDAWNTPHSQILESLQRGHQAGLDVGDLEGGFRCLLNCNYYAYSAGFLTLGPIENSGAELEEQLRQYKVNALIGIMQEVRLPVQFFLGYIAAPLNWFDLLNIDANADDASDTYRMIQGFLGRLEVCVHFGQYRVAERIVEKLEPLCGHDSSYLITTNRLLYSGLMASGMFRQTGQAKYKTLATKYRKEMKCLTRARGLNAFHKYLLMHADFEASMCGANRNDTEGIRSAFDRAIADACEIDSMHIAALGSQLAGEYFVLNKKTNETSWPHQYFTQASDYYDEWGAIAKVEHLEEKYGSFMHQQTATNSRLYSRSSTRSSERSSSLKFLAASKPKIHDELSIMIDDSGEGSEDRRGKDRNKSNIGHGDEISCLTMDNTVSLQDNDARIPLPYP